jgi:hypothetical protein
MKTINARSLFWLAAPSESEAAERGRKSRINNGQQAYGLKSRYEQQDAMGYLPRDANLPRECPKCGAKFEGFAPYAEHAKICHKVKGTL